MFSRFKSALYNAVGVEEDGVAYGADEKTYQKTLHDGQNRYSVKSTKEKHLTYCRPAFLQLSSADEVSVTADHTMRPIICPRSFLPWDAGYAETVNAGKSRHNEDQGCVYVGYLTRSLVCKSSNADTSAAAAAVPDAQPRPEDLTVVSPASTSTTPNSDSCVDPNLCDSSTVATKSMINGSIDECNGEGASGMKSKKVSVEGNEKFSDPLNTSLNTKDKLDSPSAGEIANSVNIEDNIINNSDANHFSLDRPTDTAPNENFSNLASSNCVSNAQMDHTSTLNSNNSPSGTPHFCPSVPEDKLFVDEGRGRLGVSVPYYYFAVFDGHAGWGAAVYASQHLHHILHTSLSKVSEFIIPDLEKPDNPSWQQIVSIDASSVVVGALEQAFYLMDKKIEQDRHKVGVGGGCTACIALFIMGKLYVANAGDSRATACLHGIPHSMSYDFTPETENYRIRKQGAQRPDLLGGEFTPVEFVRRPLRRELGVSLLCRHPYMARGWVYKKITEEDLKVPLVCGSGKRSRVMGTIGVTRGFGDHDLKAQLTNVHIKPFLSCEPEVRILDLEAEQLCDTDVLILATDGLWDIVTNEKAVTTLLQSMSRSLLHFPSSDPGRHKYRYMSAAQDLVMGARGKLTDRNWRTNDNKHATIDDIAVFVVPLKPYQEEHQKWKELFENRTADLVKGSSLAQQSSAPTHAADSGSSVTSNGVSPEVVSQSKATGKEGDCSCSLKNEESQLAKLNTVQNMNLPVPELHGVEQNVEQGRCSEFESKSSSSNSFTEASGLKSTSNTEVSQSVNIPDSSTTPRDECIETLTAQTSVYLRDKSSVPSDNSSDVLDEPSLCNASAQDSTHTNVTKELAMGSSGVVATAKTSSEYLDSTKTASSSSNVTSSSTDEQISSTVSHSGFLTTFPLEKEHSFESQGRPADESTAAVAQGVSQDTVSSSQSTTKTSISDPLLMSPGETIQADQQ